MCDLEGKGAGTRANPALMPISRLYVDVGKSFPKVTELKDLYSPGDEYTPKARKPYTITKQRERWSEEEHYKFLEALKLYGRAWRQIEEHVGTKTAIQIRSHAQKYFSKVVRESGDDAGSEKSIEIPPPRPKRKPVHPYPRKLVHSRMKGTSIPKLLERSLSPTDASSVSEQEKRSSTSALSAVGSDIIGSTASNPSAGCQSPVSSPVRSKLVGLLDAELESEHSLSSSSTEEENRFPLDVPVDAGLGPLDVLQSNDLILGTGNKDNISTEEGSPLEVSTPRLKLFGRTVLVVDFHRPSCRNIPQGGKSLQHADIGNHEESSDPNVHNSAPAAMEDTMQGYSSENSCITTQNPWPYGVAPWSYNMQWLQEKSHSAEASMGLPWSAFYGNLPFPVTCSYNVNSREAPPGSCTETLDDKGTNKGGFCSASNTASVCEMGVLEKENPIVNSLYGHTDKEPAASSQFKASKNSAFSSHRVTGSGNSRKGFVPYKRCIAERDMQQLHIAGNDRPEQRIRLCL